MFVLSFVFVCVRISRRVLRVTKLEFSEIVVTGIDHFVARVKGRVKRGIVRIAGESGSFLVGSRGLVVAFPSLSLQGV